MTTVNVTVKGLSELEQALDELPLKLARRAYQQSLKAGMKAILDEARRLLVGQVREHTGALVNSLRMRTRSVSGSSDPTASEVVLTVGDKTAYYARWIEFGTAAHKVVAKQGMLKIGTSGAYRKMVEVGGVRERPFMRPAFDGKAEQAIELFAEDMRDWFDGTGA